MAIWCRTTIFVCNFTLIFIQRNCIFTYCENLICHFEKLSKSLHEWYQLMKAIYQCPEKSILCAGHQSSIFPKGNGPNDKVKYILGRHCGLHVSTAAATVQGHGSGANDKILSLAGGVRSPLILRHLGRGSSVKWNESRPPRRASKTTSDRPRRMPIPKTQHVNELNMINPYNWNWLLKCIQGRALHVTILCYSPIKLWVRWIGWRPQPSSTLQHHCWPTGCSPGFHT